MRQTSKFLRDKHSVASKSRQCASKYNRLCCTFGGARWANDPFAGSCLRRNKPERSLVRRRKMDGVLQHGTASPGWNAPDCGPGVKEETSLGREGGWLIARKSWRAPRATHFPFHSASGAPVFPADGNDRWNKRNQRRSNLISDSCARWREWI